MPHAMTDATRAWIEGLHRVIDELTSPIIAGQGARLACQAGCAGCCSDDLTVFVVEAALIEHHHAELLASGVAAKAGACAFLDDAGACRIYAHRPYVCRTQGLPLLWLDQDEDGSPIEARDVCPLNADGPPLEELAVEECWTLGPIEDRLAARQRAEDGGEGRRVALRSLFAAKSPGPAAREHRRLPVTR